MPLPSLDKLSLNTTPTEVKRSRDESISAPDPYEDTESSRHAWDNDVKNWQDVVCRVWNGVPPLLNRDSSRNSLLMSPSGDWKKRQYVENAKVVPSSLNGTTCTVMRNTYGFDPNGVHKMDMEFLRRQLEIHYNVDSYTVAFDTLPPATATTSDIRKWVEGLRAPMWTEQTSSFDAYDHWREYVLSKKGTDVGESTTTGVGKITYDTTEVYTGEVLRSEGDMGVPDGFGVWKCADGSTWRGRWEKGRRTDDIGVFTDRDGNILLGKWPAGALQITSTTHLAEKELKEYQLKHCAESWTDVFLVEKPGYGRIAVALGTPNGVLRMANWHTETAIKRMMKTVDFTQLGIGRDVSEYMTAPRVYTKLLPLAVFDVDYSNSRVLYQWTQYQSELKAKLNEPYGRNVQDTFTQATRVDNCCPPSGYVDGDTWVDSNLASFGLPLQAELNERFLLHAPNADDLFAVLNTSFDTTYSRGGLFGKGIYFAEDPAKSDQYASPVHVESELSQRLGLNRESILKVLRQNAAVSEKSIAKEDSRYKQDNDFDIFFMFVCRVPLGICAEPDGIDEFNTNALPWGDEWAHSKKDVPLFEDVAVKFNLEANRYTRQDMRFAEKLSAPYTSVSVKGKFLRYREFMVYQNTVARVSHVIAYSRAREVEKEPAADSTTEKPSYKFPDYIYKKYLQDDGTLGFNGAYSDPFGDGEEID